MRNIKKADALILGIIIVVVIGLFLLIYFLNAKKEEVGKEGKGKIFQQSMEETLSQGKKAYQKYCAACHGEKGDGKGIFAKFVYPKPRDFTAGVFKLRSTPSGSVPTDNDLEKTIKQGMTGTAMPSFAYLDEKLIKSIVQYIKEFAVKCVGEKCIKFFEARKSAPMEIPPKIEKTEQLLALGKSFYKEVQCGKCHGDSGRGDGPSAEDLKDRWGYPIKVRNFTKGEYLGSNTETDLLKRFLTGMDGSPMPSFIDSIKEMAGENTEKQKQLLWGLVYYVKSLEEKDVKIANPPKDNIIYANNVASTDFNFAINAKEWETAATYEIPLNRLWQIDSNYKIAYLKILYTINKIGFLIEWEDKTPDYHNLKVGQFQDMIALQFAQEEEPPFLGMGDKEHPVNIWLYKADRQEKIVRASAIYPNIANDLPETVPNENGIFYTSKASGNLRMPDAISTQIEDLNAIGAQTITSQPPEEQNVNGFGRWQNGRWQVVFIRELKTSYKWDVQFERNKKIPVAFAIWDGSKGDRNGQKLVSTWFYLIIK